MKLSSVALNLPVEETHISKRFAFFITTTRTVSQSIRKK